MSVYIFCYVVLFVLLTCNWLCSRDMRIRLNIDVLRVTYSNLRWYKIVLFLFGNVSLRVVFLCLLTALQATTVVLDARKLKFP